MSKRIRLIRKPRLFGAGTFVAGVIACLIYNTTGAVHFFALVGLLVLASVIDGLVYRDPKPAGIYIEDEL